MMFPDRALQRSASKIHSQVLVKLVYKGWEYLNNLTNRTRQSVSAQPEPCAESTTFPSYYELLGC